jgi:hypothetical protein
MGQWASHILRMKFGISQYTKMAPFRKKCQNPLRTQWNFLQTLLERHRDTEFGKKYDFPSIRSIAEYQKRVPIHSWEDISPYIEKGIKGQQNTLFPASEKIIMFAATSGTTAQPKFIPVTETSYENYGKYWDHTWSNSIREAPKIFHGKALYFPGDPEEGYFGNIPYGAITAKAYAQQKSIVKTVYPYPYQVCRIKDYFVRYYTIMRVALETQISSIPIANPSTILTLFRVTQERREEMIDDIRMGRLRYAEQMPEDLRKALLKKIRPNPKRARELDNIYRHWGDFLPRDYWKNLSGVMCFASGPLRLYLKALKKYIGHIPILDFGLLASEGRLSFPLASLQRQDGCCPTLESNFFEFIPEDQIDSLHPEVLTIDQCHRGQRYFIIITNYSGLYRYHIVDVVEVTGFYENVPLIMFCNKGKHFSNITGEKLAEFHITEVVRKATEKVGCHLHDFVCCLHWDELNPHYSILIASRHTDKLHVLQKLVDSADEELMRMNVEYHSKRTSMRLGPLTLKVVQGNSYEDYEKKRQQTARNLSQYKHIFLVNDHQFEEQFQFSHEFPSSVDPSAFNKVP